MKLLLALLAVAVVTAHWTHDDSLAREIGPPPGEEDVDVGALSDELISVSEGASEEVRTTTKIQYRITIGTAWISSTAGGNSGGVYSSPFSAQHSWWNGASSQPLEFYLKGRRGWAGGAASDITNVDNSEWVVLRYYTGPFMDYQRSGILAPTFLPGLVPLLTGNLYGSCSRLEETTGDGPKTPRVKDCNALTAFQTKMNAASVLDWCSPNTKACVAKLKGCKGASGSDELNCDGIGYAVPPYTLLRSSTTDPTLGDKVGLIQRGQILYEDVGDITEVQVRLKDVPNCGASAWVCGSPWWPKFLKINTNNPKTGVGNVIYYIHPMSEFHLGVVKTTTTDSAGAQVETPSDNMELVAKPGELPTDASTTSMTPTHNAELLKCVAQTCEEEMDTKYGLTQLKEKFA